jgi:hypothetical protein
MSKFVASLFLFFSIVTLSFADQTAVGKIIYTQGHVAPSCRTVQHKEIGTGVIRHFRISDVAGHDDVGAVILSALLANRDVVIVFDPTQTSGCGGEPKVLYVTIF